MTMKLTEIIFLNDVIQRHRSVGAKVQMIMVRRYKERRRDNSHSGHLATPPSHVLLLFVGELGLFAAAMCTVH